MPKFTEADFLSAISSTTTTTTTQPRRNKRNLTIVVPQPGKLRLPIAPPSPFFDGMNEDINTEPFPEFIDPCPPVKAEPLHCILHCSAEICTTLTDRGFQAECRCGDEVFQPEVEVCTPPTFTVPVPELNKSIFHTAREVQEHTDPSQVIAIRHDDARKLLAALKKLIATRVTQDQDLLKKLRNYFPNREPKQIALAILEEFFNLMTLYLTRTLSTTNQRSLSVRDLRLELKLYAWTGFLDWIAEYCDIRTEEMVYHRMVHESDIMETADFGLPGAVSKIWQGCLNDVVGVLVWRDEEVKKSKADGKIVCFGMAALGGYALAAGLAFVCGYW